MPFHWCYQETEALMMLLSALPLIGFFFKRLHTRFHAKWKTLCHKENCEDKHVDHKENNNPVINVIDCGSIPSTLDVLQNPPKLNLPPFDQQAPKNTGYLTEEDIDVRREEILKVKF